MNKIPRAGEEWLLFNPHDGPLETTDGLFDVCLLMDLAYGYVIQHVCYSPVNDTVTAIDQLLKLLHMGRAELTKWPGKIWVSNKLPSANIECVTKFAGIKSIEVERASDALLHEHTHELSKTIRERHNHLGSSEEQDSSDYQHADQNEGEYSPYAPIRFRNEIWWRYAIKEAKEKRVMPNGTISNYFYPMLQSQLIDPVAQQYMESMTALGMEDQLGYVLSIITGLTDWVPMVAQYDLNGRQIFDLNDVLTEMLEQTDFQDVTLAEWHPPFDAFFIRFGKRKDIRMQLDPDQYEYLDGVFVAVSPWDELDGDTRIKFAFTTVKEDGSGVMLPGHFADILPEEKKLPVKEAITVALNRKLNSLRELAQEATDDSARNLLEYDVLRYEEGFQLLLSASELIVNALFYIENIGEFKDQEPGRDTPPELDAKWANATPVKRRKLRSKMFKDGYTLVYLIGKDVAQTKADDKHFRKYKIVFWRRGHWRKQRHGHGLSQIKRIWIKPVLVGANAEDAVSTPGHVYVTSSDKGNVRH